MVASNFSHFRHVIGIEPFYRNTQLARSARCCNPQLRCRSRTSLLAHSPPLHPGGDRHSWLVVQARISCSSPNLLISPHSFPFWHPIGSPNLRLIAVNQAWPSNFDADRAAKSRVVNNVDKTPTRIIDILSSLLPPVCDNTIPMLHRHNLVFPDACCARFAPFRRSTPKWETRLDDRPWYYSRRWYTANHPKYHPACDQCWSDKQHRLGTILVFVIDTFVPNSHSFGGRQAEF